ncbi:MAG: peptidase domain-containing ABC transporter [Woeseia sp.]
MPARDFLLGLRRRRPVPLILQQERSECGLAVIAMVAGHYGFDTGLHALRNSSSPSSRGTTVKHLVEIARDLRLIARPLRLELDEIEKLRLPAILHWRMNHFVLLVRMKRGKALIHDPAAGKRAVRKDELDRSFTGVAVELAPAREFRRSPDESRLTFSRFVGSFRNLGRYLCMMLALLITTQVLALVPPVATQMLIDEVVLGQDRTWLLRALLGLSVVMLVGILLDSSRRWIGLYAGTRLAVDSTLGVLNHLFSLPASFLHGRHLGDVMSKVESLTPIRLALTESGVNGFVQMAVMLATLTIMFAYDTWLTLVSLVGLLLSSLLAFAVLPASRRLSEQALVHAARQNSSLLESLTAFDSVRALDLGALRLTQWQKHFFSATNAGVRQAKLSILGTAGTGVIGALEQVLFLGIGISGIVEKQITLGVLFAFFSLRSRFAASAASLAAIARSFFMLRVHLERISDILLAEPERPSLARAVRTRVAGSIEAGNLRFRFPGGRYVIRDFCCSISEGETVAIAGRSGSGKTTLLRLLSAQLAPTGGRVLIDGRDIALWDRRCLRRQLGIVLQNDRLFQGSIAENIAAFDPEADLDRIRAAAIGAEIWTDIEAMPMSLNTLVGDSGTSLSGGQQQRILLARSLYRNPRVLFLDEATSHLDIDTERRILDRLADAGITIVSVAHRPDVLARADRIIELGVR